MHAHDQYHVGIVVEDLDAAKAQLSGLFGYVWGSPMGGSVLVRQRSGTGELDLRLVYSVTEPRVELVQQIAGTVWEPAAGSGVHHLGYWSDDVAADATRLEAAGYAHEASGVGADGAPMWGYYRGPTGPRIELVSRSLEPAMSALWAAPGS